MTDTASSSTSSTSSASPATSVPASSDDEPPRTRQSQLSSALARYTPLLPPLIHIALSYLTSDRLAILDGPNVRLTPLLTATADASKTGKSATSHTAMLLPQRSAVSIMHLHLDGRICTTGVKDKLVRLHATLPASNLPATPATSVLHLRHERQSPSVSSFLSLDTKRLLIGFDDGSLHCYNTRTGAKVCGMTLECGIVTLLPTTSAYAATAHSASMLSPAVSVLSPATASTDSTCTTHVIAYTTDHAFRLIDVQLCRVAKYIGRIGYVHRVFALDGGGGRVAACGERSVFVWRLYTWTCERTVNREEEERVEQHWTTLRRYTSSLTEERKDAAGSEWESKEAVYRPADSSESPTPVHRSPTSVSPLWSSAFLACAYTSGFVHVWRVGVQWSQQLLCSFHAHEGSVHRVQYLGEGRLLTGGQDGRVRVWQLAAERWGCGGAWEEVESELEGAERWSVKLLSTHEVLQDSRQWNGAALFIPGD